MKYIHNHNKATSLFAGRAISIFCYLVFSFFIVNLSLPTVFPSIAYASSFLPGSEDIPLIDGFNTDKPTVFDTPEGRILEVHATGVDSIAHVTHFYNTTLKSLGWTATQESKTSLQYVRDKNQLTIKIKVTGKSIFLSFTLEPK